MGAYCRDLIEIAELISLGCGMRVFWKFSLRLFFGFFLSWKSFHCRVSFVKLVDNQLDCILSMLSVFSEACGVDYGDHAECNHQGAG